MIVLVVDKMHGATANGHTTIKCRLMDVLAVHSLAAECWQQGRMNVDHASGKVIRYQDMFKESRHHNILGLALAYGIKHRIAVRLLVVFGLANHLCLNPVSLGDLNTAHFGAAANHQADIDGQTVLVAMT